MKGKNMDKKELILRKLSIIGLNNKITELNNIIETQNERNASSYDKSKQLFTELVQNNKKLIEEKNTLTQELALVKDEVLSLKGKLTYQEAIINKIPKFFLKLILRKKDIKLLNEKND